MLNTSQYPALVLNEDLTPMSLLPLSLLNWQDAIHAVIAGRMLVVHEYDRKLRSPSVELKMPAVIKMKEQRNLHRRAPFNRANLLVRDGGRCQYCGTKLMMDELTLDHVTPRSKGGKTVYTNLVAACDKCNLLKGDRDPEEVGLMLRRQPYHPTLYQLNQSARAMKLAHVERLATQNPLWGPYLLS